MRHFLAYILSLSFLFSLILFSYSYWHACTGEAYQLDLDGSLLVGGVGTIVDNAAIPAGLWSATLHYGYVGCMRDLVVNGNAVDLAAFARQQDSGK